MQGVRTLYTATRDSLEMEKINEGMTNLAEIDIMLTITTIRLVNHNLSFKQ